MASIQETVQKYLDANDIVVFSRCYCPYSECAKSLAKSLKADYQFIELNELNEGFEIQDYLEERTGQLRLPNVFVKGKYIGGCDKFVMAIQSGQVKELLG